LLDEVAHQGVAVLMISSELPEVLGMADRVLVLREGRIAAEFTRDEADEALIMRAATGQLAPSSAVGR
jgi:ABC-type sugar transport system ATPase subunit